MYLDLNCKYFKYIFYVYESDNKNHYETEYKITHIIQKAAEY